MTYKPGHLRERSRDIVNARNWGIGVAATVLGLALFVSEIQRIRVLQFDALQYAYLGLLLLTGALVFLWIWATQKELDLLFDWLDPERWVPPSSVKETFLILFIAITLATLLFAARNPLAYGIVFSFYTALLIPSTNYFNKKIKEAIDRSKGRLESDSVDSTLAVKMHLYLAAIAILEGYFLNRPMIKRQVVILLASGVSTCVAAYWYFTNEHSAGIAAYVGFFGVILVSEAFIGRWRLIRDELLRVQRELVELLREDNTATEQERRRGKRGHKGSAA